MTITANRPITKWSTAELQHAQEGLARSADAVERWAGEYRAEAAEMRAELDRRKKPHVARPRRFQ